MNQPLDLRRVRAQRTIFTSSLILAITGLAVCLLGSIANSSSITTWGLLLLAISMAVFFILGRAPLATPDRESAAPYDLSTDSQSSPEENFVSVKKVRSDSPPIFDFDAPDVTVTTESPTSRSHHLEKYRAAGMLQPDETVESLASRYNVDTETVVQVLESGLEALQQMLQQGLASRETAKKAFRPAFHRLLHRTSIIESAVSELSILETELRRQFPRGSVIFGFYSLYPEEVESYLARLSSAGDSSRERIERILKSMYQRLSENSFGPSEIESARDAVKPYVDRIVTALNPLS